jgi:hypothetical protein
MAMARAKKERRDSAKTSLRKSARSVGTPTSGLAQKVVEIVLEAATAVGAPAKEAAAKITG